MNATDRPAPLLLTPDDICQALQVGRTTFFRMLSAGEFPRPDKRIGRLPRWKPATLQRWIDKPTR